MQYQPIKGVIVPMLTPFDERDEVDFSAARKLANYLIARGVKGLFPIGTTGEGPLLSLEERQKLAEVVVEEAGGRVPVIIHTGAITTREVITLTRHARDVGADAVAIIPPFYFHYADAALIEHFRAIVEAVADFPIYLYNNPAVTGNTLSTAVVTQLANAYPSVVGLKDSGGSLATLFAANDLQNGAFNTAIGPDGLILAGLALGLDACVSGNANAVPELVVALYDAAAAGDLVRARALQKKLDAVRAILRDGADLSLFKGVLAKRGLAVGTVRPPLLPASEAKIAECWQALTALGLELQPV